MMVKCSQCGAAIRYIPSGFSQSNMQVIKVEAELKELITESGRVVKGYPRHECSKNHEAAPGVDYWPDGGEVKGDVRVSQGKVDCGIVEGNVSVSRGSITSGRR